MKPLLDRPRIGILMDWYRPQIVQGAMSYCRNHDLHLDVNYAQRPDWLIAEELSDWKAAIIHLPASRQVREQLRELRIPCVSLSPDPAEEYRIFNDYAACGALVADELEAIACGAVLVDHSRQGVPGMGAAFEEAIIKACKDRDCFEVRSVQVGRSNAEPLIEAMATVRKGTKTAFVSLHAGKLSRLECDLDSRGLRVPEDLVLIALDKDTQGTAAYAPIPLTAIEPDYWQRGLRAAKLCHRLIKGQKIERKTQIIAPLGLVRRASSGAVEEDDPYVSRLVELIQESVERTVTVGELMSRVGLSRRSMELRFREVMLCSPLEYLIQKRLERGCSLLVRTDETLEEIANRCGFTSAAYFARTFRRLMGETPGTYRKRENAAKI